MSDNIQIKAEFKDSENLRKLARALLLLAEKQAKEAKEKAERQWAKQYAGKEAEGSKESAA
jgi:hypothetical protein